MGKNKPKQQEVKRGCPTWLCVLIVLIVLATSVKVWFNPHVEAEREWVIKEYDNDFLECRGASDTPQALCEGNIGERTDYGGGKCYIGRGNGRCFIKTEVITKHLRFGEETPTVAETVIPVAQEEQAGCQTTEEIFLVDDTDKITNSQEIAIELAGYVNITQVEDYYFNITLEVSETFTAFDYELEKQGIKSVVYNYKECFINGSDNVTATIVPGRDNFIMHNSVPSIYQVRCYGVRDSINPYMGYIIKSGKWYYD